MVQRQCEGQSSPTEIDGLHLLEAELDRYIRDDETTLADVEDEEQADQESVPQTVREPLEVRPRPGCGERASGESER